MQSNAYGSAIALSTKFSLLFQQCYLSYVENYTHILLQIENPITTSKNTSYFPASAKPHAHATVGSHPSQNTVRTSRAGAGEYLAFSLEAEIEAELTEILACAPALSPEYIIRNMPYNGLERMKDTMEAFLTCGVIDSSLNIIDPLGFYKLIDTQFYLSPKLSPNETTRLLGHYHGGLFRALYFALHNWSDEGFICTSFAITCIQAAYLKKRGFLTDFALNEHSTLSEIEHIVHKISFMSEAERIPLMERYLPRDLQIDAGIMNPDLLLNHFRLQNTLSIHNPTQLILSDRLTPELKPYVEVKSKAVAFSHALSAELAEKPLSTEIEHARAWLVVPNKKDATYPMKTSTASVTAPADRVEHKRVVQIDDITPVVHGAGVPPSAAKATLPKTDEIILAAPTTEARLATAVTTKTSWCCTFRSTKVTPIGTEVKPHA